MSRESGGRDDVANTEQILRIIQSIPSKKAEPFKLWLEKVGKDRLDEIAIKVIGVFKRSDLDHKYVVVEVTREVDDFWQLRVEEKEELNRLYPRIREGEGWYGKEEAEYCMMHHQKAL